MMSGGNSLNSDEWKDFDFSTVKVEKPRATRALQKREVTRLVIIGLVRGAFVWLVRLALENWVMRPLFCRTPDTASVCTDASMISFIIALVLVGIIATTILASQRIPRAILIATAAFVSVGALWPLLSMRGAVMATVITALFTAGLFLFFALVAAVKHRSLSIILLAALTLAFWLLVRA